MLKQIRKKERKEKERKKKPAERNGERNKENKIEVFFLVWTQKKIYLNSRNRGTTRLLLFCINFDKM